MVLKNKKNNHSANAELQVSNLLQIMKELRDENTGCPWDKVQTFDTIAKYTIEEAYEVLEAISNKDWENLKEELGDLLLQVVYHSQIANELNLFNFNEVVAKISEKMISRHPHVFGEEKINKSISQQSIDWELIKETENRINQNKHKYLLDNIPNALPALIKADKLQKKASKVNFDWDKIKDVLDKLNEEFLELLKALEVSNQKQIEEELGDILFTIVNLARKLNVDSEQALSKTNDKFKKRINGIEDQLSKTNKSINDVSQKILEEMWQAQKKKLEK